MSQQRERSMIFRPALGNILRTRSYSWNPISDCSKALLPKYYHAWRQHSTSLLAFGNTTSQDLLVLIWEPAAGSKGIQPMGAAHILQRETCRGQRKHRLDSARGVDWFAWKTWTARLATLTATPTTRNCIGLRPRKDQLASETCDASLGNFHFLPTSTQYRRTADRDGMAGKCRRQLQELLCRRGSLLISSFFL